MNIWKEITKKKENTDKEENKEKENKDKEEREAKEKLIKEQMKRVENNFKKYYEKAKSFQTKLNINCIGSEPNSISKENSFPENMNSDIDNIKKLFMCKCAYKEFNDFTTEKSDNSYIKEFFIENLINITLKEIEEKILKAIKNSDNYKNYKDYLNNNIGRFYN